MSFRPGDLVLLVDGKQRRYLVSLQAGQAFHSHHGPLDHDDIIGRPQGTEVVSRMGRKMVALRPTLADYTLKMPRGATVVYPKDTGAILVECDIAPGMAVLEAGTGSGALTLALLRAVGADGVVHTFDVRRDHHDNAMRNIKRFAGAGYGRLDARVADVFSDDLGITVDRVVLDLTEPWLAMDNVERCLRPGGVCVVYMPTITQVQRFIERVSRPGWAMTETFEILRRTWNVDGLSVRPDHRMVAHTAFLVVTRRLALI